MGGIRRGLFAGIEGAIGGGIGIFLVETGGLWFAGAEDDAEFLGELVVISAVFKWCGGWFVVTLEEVDELGQLLLDLDLLHPCLNRYINITQSLYLQSPSYIHYIHHYQAINYFLSSIPLRMGGRDRPAVVLISSNGLCFV